MNHLTRRAAIPKVGRATEEAEWTNDKPSPETLAPPTWMMVGTTSGEVNKDIPRQTPYGRGESYGGRSRDSDQGGYR